MLVTYSKFGGRECNCYRMTRKVTSTKPPLPFPVLSAIKVYGTRIELIEPAVKFIELTVELIEPAVERIEPAVELIEPAVELYELLSSNSTTQVLSSTMGLFSMKDKILCVIENQMSNDRCKEVARGGVTDGGDATTACEFLLSFRDSLPVFGCSNKDFELLRSIVCDQEDVPCKWM
ncbi:hypothetical protein Btru_037942 [Bulinus truncatus]|nr:hypothetical protein Btru_037942 [Bulinus truncatus]